MARRKGRGTVVWWMALAIPAAGVVGCDEAEPCTDAHRFGTLPVALDDIAYLGPIGILAPAGGSPLPKSHTGFMLNGPSLSFQAPGAMTITNIRRTRFIESPSRPGYEDYALSFRVCAEVSGHFGHLAEVADVFSRALSGLRCSTYTTVDETVENCEGNVNLKVEEGQLLGRSSAFEHTRTIDVGMKDSRLSDGYLNPKRYDKRGQPGTMCPWDWYRDDLKSTLYDKIGDGMVLATEEPRCGLIPADLRGTAQGRWTPEAAPGNGADPASGEFLVLSPDPWAPQSRIAFSTRVAAIQPGGDGFPRFPVATSGRVNRQANEVTEDGQIYCFTTDLAEASESFFVRVEPNERLNVERIEHGAGASPCTDGPTGWSFSDKAVALIR